MINESYSTWVLPDWEDDVEFSIYIGLLMALFQR